MEFTGNIDDYDVRQCVTDEIDSRELVEESDVVTLIENTDWRDLPDLSKDIKFLDKRIVVLEEALEAAQKFICAMLMGPKVDDSDIEKSDAPEA